MTSADQQSLDFELDKPRIHRAYPPNRKLRIKQDQITMDGTVAGLHVLVTDVDEFLQKKDLQGRSIRSITECQPDDVEDRAPGEIIALPDAFPTPTLIGDFSPDEIRLFSLDKNVLQIETADHFRPNSNLVSAMIASVAGTRPALKTAAEETESPLEEEAEPSGVEEDEIMTAAGPEDDSSGDLTAAPGKKPKHRIGLWVGIAACFLIIVIAGTILIPRLAEWAENEGSPVTTSGDPAASEQTGIARDDKPGVTVPSARDESPAVDHAGERIDTQDDHSVAYPAEPGIQDARPPSVSSEWRKAIDLHDAGRYEEALAAFHDIQLEEDLSPEDNASVDYCIASCYEGKKNYALAVEGYSAFLSKYPDHRLASRAFPRKMRCLIHAGQYENAEAVAKEAMERFPENWDVYGSLYLNYAIMFDRLGYRDAAIENLRKIVEEFPENSATAEARAMLTRYQKDQH